MGTSNRLDALIADESGAIGVMTAIVMTLMLLVAGLVIDISDGFVARNQLQATADAAALAGALAIPGGDAAVKASANGIAGLNMPVAKYGNVLAGADVKTGNWVSATRVFTAGGTPLNAVQIAARRSSTNSNPLPTFFAGLAGFNSLDVNVKAVALRSGRDYCILALATSGDGIHSNGASKADLAGCNIMSNANMRCNGHDLNAPYGDAHGTDRGCGVIKTPNLPVVPDPYVGLASNIPANTCSSYPQQPKKGTLPSSNLLTGTLSFSSPKTLCGDVQLKANVTLTGTNNVLVVRNGHLDMNTFTIKTATGASATIIFSGPDASGSYNHTPIGGGEINISSPTSGAWSGVAIYTDPALTSGVDISSAGNSPSWNISGLAYFPHASITFNGAVGKATSGFACFVLVAETISVSGTGSILNRGQCPEQGLAMPSNPAIARARLVA